MGKKDLYSFRTTGPASWEIHKVDENFEKSGDVYTLSNTEGQLNCSCFAGTRETCRHRQMLPEFMAEEAINTNKWYWYDKRKWVIGPSNE